MESLDRERIVTHLRSLIAGERRGLILDTAENWEVEGVIDPTTFLAALPNLLPKGAILYFEGCTIAPEIASFYAAHRTAHPTEIARDTISPVPETFHVDWSPELTSQLQRWLAEHPSEAMFDHLKAYRQDTLLFTFHDAFYGTLLISDHVRQPPCMNFAALSR